LFSVTKRAARQIRASARAGDSEELPLRIAASRQADGAIDYRMGFDEPAQGDLFVEANGVDILIAEQHKTLLSGTTLDYVEIEPGDERFIFLNPNDPHYVSPDAES
jgi:iron-sulfur cluster assembly protein